MARLIQRLPKKIVKGPRQTIDRRRHAKVVAVGGGLRQDGFGCAVVAALHVGVLQFSVIADEHVREKHHEGANLIVGGLHIERRRARSSRAHWHSSTMAKTSDGPDVSNRPVTLAQPELDQHLQEEVLVVPSSVVEGERQEKLAILVHEQAVSVVMHDLPQRRLGQIVVLVALAPPRVPRTTHSGQHGHPRHHPGAAHLHLL